MAKHRTHSIAFKRQVAQEYLAGETLHCPARRHDLSRTLIRIWVDKYEAGAFDEDAEAASMIQEYEARIAGPGARVPKGFLDRRSGRSFEPVHDQAELMIYATPLPRARWLSAKA